MNKLISASDVARRDKKKSVAEWVRDISALKVHEKKILAVWDGKSISGEAVKAFVNTGRILAGCECGNHEYVCFEEPIFFCMQCGNGNSGAARPVEFPQDWAEIEAALIARPIFPGPGLDEVQSIFRSRPVMSAWKRNWTPDVTLETLLAENARYQNGGKQ